MITQLLRLEYVFNKKMLVFSGIMIFALSAIYPMLIPKVSISFAIGAVYLGLLPVSLIAKASKFQVEGTICCLPVTRKEIVISKYLFIGATAAVCYIVFLAILIIAPFPGYSAGDVVRLDPIVNSLLAIILVGSFILPLVLRYGYNGVMYFILGLNLLTVLAFMFTAIGGATDILDFVFREIPRGFRSVRATLGAGGYFLTATAVGTAAIFASLAVSARLYARKEM